MLIAKQAQEAQVQSRSLSEDKRNLALLEISKNLLLKQNLILEENRKDLEEARKNQLPPALVDRLQLTSDRIFSMAKAVENISNQEAVVHQITHQHIREDGLMIQKERVPLGVIGMIFESRPNVVVDCSALAIKSGNAMILKGGKEAHHSNLILSQIVRQSISNFIPINLIQLIESREDIHELLKQTQYVDVIIPRGGESLIRYVYEHSQIPVIAHFKGLCHLFIDQSANLEQAKNIVLNAKTQRPGVCNALETLLLHQDLPYEFIKDLFENLTQKSCELRVCPKTPKVIDQLQMATIEDWSTEYLDSILSIKTVSDVHEAISHIQQYGSHHTEAILSQDQMHIELFKNAIDASSIMINASTRFNDGGEYGLGAELGISTTKLHAYGPMGAKEMTTERFIVLGKGHIRI